MSVTIEDRVLDEMCAEKAKRERLAEQQAERQRRIDAMSPGERAEFDRRLKDAEKARWGAQFLFLAIFIGVPLLFFLALLADLTGLWPWVSMP